MLEEKMEAENPEVSIKKLCELCVKALTQIPGTINLSVESLTLKLVAFCDRLKKLSPPVQNALLFHAIQDIIDSKLTAPFLSSGFVETMLNASTLNPRQLFDLYFPIVFNGCSDPTMFIPNSTSIAKGFQRIMKFLVEKRNAELYLAAEDGVSLIDYISKKAFHLLPNTEVSFYDLYHEPHLGYLKNERYDAVMQKLWLANLHLDSIAYPASDVTPENMIFYLEKGQEKLKLLMLEFFPPVVVEVIFDYLKARVTYFNSPESAKKYFDTDTTSRLRLDEIKKAAKSKIKWQFNSSQAVRTLTAISDGELTPEVIMESERLWLSKLGL